MTEAACAYCGASGVPMHLDHVVPRSRGGPDDPTNLVTACAPCNLSKNDLLPSEWDGDVPEHVRAIEERVSRAVVVRCRARRGTSANTRRLPCDRCGTNVLETYSQTTSDVGHVVWREERLRNWRPGKVRVGHFLVWCMECVHAISEIRSVPYDIPIDWFAGDLAVHRVFDILDRFDVTPKGRLRLEEIATIFSQLPPPDATKPRDR